MLIAVLGTRGFPKVQGGIEAHCENLYPLLVKRGHEVTVFARKPYVALNNPFYHNGVRIIPLSTSKNKFLEAWIHTLSGLFLAKKIRPDILHIHGIGPAFFVPLARCMGMKVIMTHHGQDYKRKKWGILAKVFLKLSEYLGCKFSHGVIFISETIPAAVKMNGRKFSIISNGFTPVKIQQSQKLLNNYGLSKGKYILAIGRLVPEKGFHDLIEAFELALSFDNNSLTEWKLVIVGAADHEDNYSRYLKVKNKEPVILTGFLNGENLGELYNHAGIFVLSSYHEGAPIVLLDALGYGLSCIASDIEANKNFEISPERFFKPGDVCGLKEKIIQFSACRLSEAEIEKQKDMIRERFNWGKIAEETLRLYKKVVF